MNPESAKDIKDTKEMEAMEEEVGEVGENSQLLEVLDFYDCADLLPYAEHVIWLSNLKEAYGIIPLEFDLDWDEYRALVILQNEVNRKMAFDAREARKPVAGITNIESQIAALRR